MAERVDLGDVRHVARLARLALTDEQARTITRDLNTILGHMDVLARVDTTGAPEYVASAAHTPLRADRSHDVPPGAHPETFAPATRDGYFIVPRLATHEDSES